MPLRTSSLAGVAVAILLWATLASADVVLLAGNNPQPGEEAVTLLSGALGAIIQGTTSTTPVQFSSTTDVLQVPFIGTSRIEAVDGAMNNLSISVPGGSFQALIFDGNEDSGTSVTLSALANEPGGGQALQQFFIGFGAGTNFFTLLAINGETFASVTIDAPEGFTDLRSIRIAGAEGSGSPVPEASTLLLMAGAALGIGLLRWRLTWRISAARPSASP